MEFVLKWTEQEWTGSIAANGQSGTYNVHAPISVQQFSARDLGCGTSSQSPTSSAQILATRPPVVIPTTIPSPTLQQDTATGTILEVGQTWKQAGAEITLQDTELHPARDDNYGQLYLSWQFTNNTPRDIVFTFNYSNFAAQDNFGSKLKILRFYNESFWCDGDSVVLKQGKSFDFSNMCPVVSGYKLPIVVNLSNRQLTQVIVTANGISSIVKAQWKIPIFH